jgi:hypothetical protein
VQLDVDFAQKASTDDLPDQAKNQMFPNLDNITASYINDGTTDTFRRVDNDIVVLGHLESIQLLGFLPGSVQNTLVNSIRHAVINELREYQAILTFIKHLKSIRWEGEKMSDIRIAGEDSIDVAGELGPLVLVYRVRHIRRGSLDVNLPTDATFGDVARRRAARDRSWRKRGGGLRGIALASYLGNELERL